MVSYCVTEHFKHEPQQVKIASKGVLAGRLTLTTYERHIMPVPHDYNSINYGLLNNLARLEEYHLHGKWVGILPADTKGNYPNHSSAENELKSTISSEQDIILAASFAAVFEASSGKDGAI